jgi:hypothetical protein
MPSLSSKNRKKQPRDNYVGAVVIILALAVLIAVIRGSVDAYAVLNAAGPIIGAAIGYFLKQSR